MLASKVGELKIATGTVPRDRRLMLLGKVPGLISMSTISMAKPILATKTSQPPAQGLTGVPQGNRQTRHIDVAASIHGYLSKIRIQE